MHAIMAQISMDHETLKQVLGSANLMVENGMLEQNRSELPEMVDFFLKFMDQYHHGKEEKLVFPMADNAHPAVRSQIPELIAEHHKAKEYADQMKLALEKNDMNGFGEAVKALVPHMYTHMGKEDAFIYPIMLDTFSDPTKDLELLGKQEEFIKQEVGIEYLNRSYNYAGHLQRVTLGQAIGRQMAPARPR
jgi:hemerythrin-like domain-containing protein